MVVTSGEPYDWPFELFDPRSFKMPRRQITRVYLHCDAWDTLAFRGVALAEEINRWHLAEGWKGICWHFIVDKSGNVVTGRSLEESPIIDASPVNGDALVISAHGLWHFTPAQLKSIAVLCSVINEVYQLEGKSVTFHGLSEVIPLPSPTFNYKVLLGLNASGALAAHHVMDADHVANAATLMHPVGGEP